MATKLSFAQQIKQKLCNSISRLADDVSQFVKRPGKDFSRHRKLDFINCMRFIVSMEGSTLNKELLSFFQYETDTPSASAFIQQRDKIKISAFESLFHNFNRETPFQKLFHGYHLMACDGSDLNITRNPADTETYHNSGTDGHSSLGYNLIHLNALYDLLERRYAEAVLQPGRQKNEYRALCDMMDRYSAESVGKTIFIADRGYCSYNVFAHAMENGEYFLIRSKDRDKKGMLSNLPLPTSPEFDVTVNLNLNRRNTKKLMNQPGINKFIGKDVDFDFITPGSDDSYRMTLRIVRIQVSEDSYECIITNLPPDEFPPSVIKELYHMRWGIETSFRELKYAVPLIRFHAKKRDYIEQEIWARLILYNFCEIITTHVVISQSINRIHAYQVNFTMGIHICHKFLRQLAGETPMKVKRLIRKYILPVRPGRQYERKIKFQKPSSFIYRIS